MCVCGGGGAEVQDRIVRPTRDPVYVCVRARARSNTKPKHGDSAAAETSKAVQLTARTLLPIVKAKVEFPLVAVPVRCPRMRWFVCACACVRAGGGEGGWECQC